jgi:hypothetical protein
MTIPLGVATDPAGNVYIGGGGDSVVRRVDAAALTIATIAGNPQNPGAVGFAGDGGPATSATLNNTGLSVNGSESLLIADNGNNRIRQVNMVPVLRRSPSSLTFPATTVGQNSAPQVVNYNNDAGAADQILGAFSITGDTADFKIQSNTCGGLLAPDNKCSVTIVFTPQAVGARTGSLVIAGTTSKTKLSGTGQ